MNYCKGCGLCAHECPKEAILMVREARMMNRSKSGHLDFLNGDEAVAYGARLCRPHVIAVYPITPQTIVVEKISEFVGQ